MAECIYVKITVIFFLLALVSNLQAQTLFTESFNYTVGTELTAANAAWEQVNTGDTVIIASGSLTVPGLATSEGGHVAYDGAGIDYQRSFTPVSSGKVWYSALVQVTDLTGFTTAGYFLGLAAGSTTFSGVTWIVPDTATTYKFGFSPDTTPVPPANASVPFTLNTTHFIVASFDIDADTASFWLNPPSNTFGAANAPTPTFADLTANTKRSNLERFFLRQDSTSETPFLKVDEIRVGTSWASVTPVPEPTTFAVIIATVVLALAVRRKK